MRKIFLSILGSLWLFVAYAQTNNDAVIFEAMQTELDRNMNGLTMPNMPTPFFINYIAAEGESIGIVATLGGLLSSRHIPIVRSFWGRVLTESNQLTNDGRFANQGTSALLPIDDNLGQMRRTIWATSDTEYKRGLEALTNKKNALRRVTLTEEEEALLDYHTAAPVQMVTPSIFPKKMDQKELEALCRDLSAIFLNYPQLYESRVQLVANQGTFYNITSEGTKTQQPLSYAIIRASARVRSQEGALLSDYIEVCTRDLSTLPSAAELTTLVNEFAAALQAIGTAEAVKEYYSGPVLFEGDAVIDIFTGNLLTPNALIAYRRPVGGPQMLGGMGRGGQGLGGGGGAQSSSIRNIPIGLKLIDTRFTVINHTQMTEYKGKSLVGAYSVDGEGIVPAPSQLLVEKGILKSFLNNRIPTQYAPTSNGNNRIAVNLGTISTDVKPSVLEIQATGGLDNQAMRQRLITSAKEEGLAYAYIVRKLSGVVKIYQVDVATGKETPMRAPDIENINIKRLKRIDAVSSEVQVANRLLSGANDNTRAFPVSVISPNALLLQDVEINSSTVTLEIKPHVKNPLERP